MRKLTAGVDLGTQSVRVTLLEEDGRVVASGTALLTSVRSSGRHEQDPAAWWEAVGAASRRATREVADGDIAGLAICSTSGTILLADAACRPLTPAIMYDDGRAEEEARLAQEAGRAVWDSLGYQMRSSFALPRLLWLLRHGFGAGAARMMHSADFIAAQLADEPVATDWSHALKTGYDLIDDRWPAEVFERLHIPMRLLPPVVRPGSTIGHVGRRGAEQTGFPMGTPIRAGMTDSCAAQVAAGALAEGSWNSVLGTTLALKGVTRDLLHDPHGVIYSHRHPDGGWLPGGASSTGAGFLSTTFAGRDLAELDARAEARGLSSAVIYPLASEGERFPFAVPTARSFELGEPRDEVDRYRAILEGVAFVERLCYASAEALGARVSGPVAFTGGAARSPFWSQLRSDVLGLPAVVPASSEPAVGMAILAAAGAGSVTEAAARMSRVATRLEPDGDGAAGMAASFDRFASALVERGYIDDGLARRARMG